MKEFLVEISIKNDEKILNFEGKKLKEIDYSKKKK